MLKAKWYIALAFFVLGAVGLVLGAILPPNRDPSVWAATSIVAGVSWSVGCVIEDKIDSLYGAKSVGDTDE